MDIIERLIAIRNTDKLTRGERETLADACNEIERLRHDKKALADALTKVTNRLAGAIV